MHLLTDLEVNGKHTENNSNQAHTHACMYAWMDRLKTVPLVIHRIGNRSIIQRKCPIILYPNWQIVITGCAIEPAVLTATGLVNGKWQNSTPHRAHTP